MGAGVVSGLFSFARLCCGSRLYFPTLSLQASAGWILELQMNLHWTS